MIIVMVLAVWVIAAPSGYIVGQLASDYYKDEGLGSVLPVCCALFPPLAAIVALTLIMKETR